MFPGKFGDVRVPSPTVRTRTDGARRMSPVPERKEKCVRGGVRGMGVRVSGVWV